MPSELDDLAFRESIFIWLQQRMRVTDALSRDDLSHFEFHGMRHRLVGTQTGIWRVKAVSDAAVDTFDGPTLQQFAQGRRCQRTLGR